jgi:hypothetical protein
VRWEEGRKRKGKGSLCLLKEEKMMKDAEWVRKNAVITGTAVSGVYV